jgi:UPF0176 protein
MSYLNIAGYQFTPFHDCAALRANLLAECQRLGLMGTILISPEGINLSLAGVVSAIRDFQAVLHQLPGLETMWFHESYSDFVPFMRLKVKLKKEIITLRLPNTTPNEATRAKALAPHELKQWLDEGRDITLLDTRNDYEIKAGAFKGALNPHVDHFTQLPAAVSTLDKKKPVVMYCTGGIRCEKASLMMQQQGFEEVYQLDGGILGYFAKVGGAHYEGRCFVFDERVALDPKLSC